MLPKQRQLRNECNWMQSDGCHLGGCIFEMVRSSTPSFVFPVKCLRHNKSDAVCNFLLWMLNLLECLNTIDNFRQKTTEEVIRKRAKLSLCCRIQWIYIHTMLSYCRVLVAMDQMVSIYIYIHTHTQWFMPRWNEFCWSLPVHWERQREWDNDGGMARIATCRYRKQGKHKSVSRNRIEFIQRP